MMKSKPRADVIRERGELEHEGLMFSDVLEACIVINLSHLSIKVCIIVFTS